MRYAVISDVHANASALRLVLADAAREGAERVICLGDVVGYGPLPAETLAIVRKSAAVVVAGNHDDAVSGRLDAGDFADIACDAVMRHRDALAKKDIEWLRGLPHTCAFDGAAAAHGDFTDPTRFFYTETEDDARASFEATGEQLLFVGHTHVPKVFLTGRSGRVYATDPQDFTLEDGKRYIVNPGSVGYPREAGGVCFSSYAIYDSDERTVVFRRLPFSVSSVMQRGGSAKKAVRRVAAAVAVAAAAAAAAAAFLLAPKTSVTTVVNETKVYAEDDPSLLLAARPLKLGPQDRAVRANLSVKGDPVVLRIEFKGAAGETLDIFEATVKKSNAKAVKVPPDAKSALFSAKLARKGANSSIVEFGPSACAK